MGLREKIERNGNSWIYSGDKTTAVGEAALFRLDVSQHELRQVNERAWVLPPAREGPLLNE
ncbi:MAG: hypothetical protein ED554_13265 [Synechococcus sp. YX04-3]|nr:MAG: hypothetical protein ED554_13265 [Synechococcus sp. YX04-3]